VQLVLATRNAHKRREFARLLERRKHALPITLLALPEDLVLPPEVGQTFAENALEKARAAAAGSRRASIADDSGIEADALGGNPGVRSARYASEHATDEQNLNKLMREAPAGSALRYVCALAFVDERCRLERVFTGRCAGRMAAVARGGNGFGYDPAFVPDEQQGELTMAELSDARKDAISHRGRAARALLAWLEEVDRG
jgi:XTP/dITP diphosphohydrolase